MMDWPVASTGLVRHCDSLLDALAVGISDGGERNAACSVLSTVVDKFAPQENMICFNVQLPIDVANEDPVAWNRAVRKGFRLVKGDLSDVLFSDDAIRKWKAYCKARKSYSKWFCRKKWLGSGRSLDCHGR